MNRAEVRAEVDRIFHEKAEAAAECAVARFLAIKTGAPVPPECREKRWIDSMGGAAEASRATSEAKAALQTMTDPMDALRLLANSAKNFAAVTVERLTDDILARHPSGATLLAIRDHIEGLLPA